MNAIEVKHLMHSFGSKAVLHDVDMKVQQGSVYALLGRNGVGKSTLLQILMGLRAPTQVECLTIFGSVVSEMSIEERARIAYVAEGLKLPNWMTLTELENFAAPLYKQWSDELADDLRRRFYLESDKRIGAMSRGDQMKSALLVALAARPRLLLLDEPFTGIDVISKDEIVRAILNTAALDGCTVVIASHDIAEIEFLADTIGILSGSRLRLSDSLERLQDRFRRVELMTDSNDTIQLPPNYHVVERAGQRISFVLERRSQEPEAVEIRSLIPAARDFDVRPATLREMFTAVAVAPMEV
jgi:ABC-2 type transport system ATP-binding protein